jgi:hypothetical protein
MYGITSPLNDCRGDVWGDSLGAEIVIMILFSMYMRDPSHIVHHSLHHTRLKFFGSNKCLPASLVGREEFYP